MYPLRENPVEISLGAGRAWEGRLEAINIRRHAKKSRSPGPGLLCVKWTAPDTFET